jgi:hypothetical protein
MVAAARRHLTGIYSRGVDRLLWDTDKRLMADPEAVGAVLAAASAGEPVDALDLGAALVLTQSARLDLDRTEFELFETCYKTGLSDEVIASVLELPGQSAAAERYRWLQARHDCPRAEVSTGSADASEAAEQAASRAARRAEQARTRAAQAARRQQELGQTHQPGAVSLEHAERAAAQAGEARILAGEAHERLSLGLLRAADRLDSCAAACEQLAGTTGAAEQLHVAREYRRDAQRLRQMAAGYREPGRR